MRTRGDELAEAFDKLATLLEVADRDVLANIVARTGWAERPITAPLLPSGVRHGVPWGLSIAMTPETTELRVWLEAQADPPSAAAYLAAGEALLADRFDRSPAIATPERWWHQLGFARGRAVRFHAYACVPDHPDVAWEALARRGHDVEALRRALPSRAFVTMLSIDLDGPRMKLYVLVPEARVDELPLIAADARAFARVVHDDDAPIGWLVCYGFVPEDRAPSSVALHFGAAVHGDRELPARLAAELERRHLPPYAELGPLHFVAYTQGERPKLSIYFTPQVAR